MNAFATLLCFFIGGVHCSSESTGQGEDWGLESQDRGQAWAEVSYETAVHRPACLIITFFIHLPSLSHFSSLFLPLPVCRVVELTGDVTPDMRAIAQADLIVTTPEKWDGVSRSWQNRSYVQKVALLIIDEIHLLGKYTQIWWPFALKLLECNKNLFQYQYKNILFVNFALDTCDNFALDLILALFKPTHIFIYLFFKVHPVFA